MCAAAFGLAHIPLDLTGSLSETYYHSQPSAPLRAYESYLMYAAAYGLAHSLLDPIGALSDIRYPSQPSSSLLVYFSYVLYAAAFGLAQSPCATLSIGFFHRLYNPDHPPGLHLDVRVIFIRYLYARPAVSFVNNHLACSWVEPILEMVSNTPVTMTIETSLIHHIIAFSLLLQ